MVVSILLPSQPASLVPWELLFSCIQNLSKVHIWEVHNHSKFSQGVCSDQIVLSFNETLFASGVRAKSKWKSLHLVGLSNTQDSLYCHCVYSWVSTQFIHSHCRFLSRIQYKKINEPVSNSNANLGVFQTSNCMGW